MLCVIDVRNFVQGRFTFNYFRIYFLQCKWEAKIIYKIKNLFYIQLLQNYFIVV